MKEKPKQSLENQLQMARPKRAEVKRVPLTPEEKEFLGEIMDKAVAAEKAGKLQEALDLYTDYKNELLKIKEEKEKFDKIKEEPGIKSLIAMGLDRKFIEENFDLTKLPEIKSKGDLLFSGMKIKEFPNITVNGNLDLGSSTINKWDSGGLMINGDFILSAVDTKSLPDGIFVVGNVYLQNSTIQDLPDEFHVDRDIYVKNCNAKVKQKAQVLKVTGRIKGSVHN